MALQRCEVGLSFVFHGTSQLLGWRVIDQCWLLVWSADRTVQLWSLEGRVRVLQVRLGWVPTDGLRCGAGLLLIGGSNAVLLSLEHGAVLGTWVVDGPIGWSGSLPDGRMVLANHSYRPRVTLVAPGKDEPLLWFDLPGYDVDPVEVNSCILGIEFGRLLFWTDTQVQCVDLDDLNDWWVFWEGGVRLTGGAIVGDTLLCWDEEHAVRCFSASAVRRLWTHALAGPVCGFWRSASDWLLWSDGEVLQSDGRAVSTGNGASEWCRAEDGILVARLKTGGLARGASLQPMWTPELPIVAAEVAGSWLVVQQEDRVSWSRWCPEEKIAASGGAPRLESAEPR